MNFFWLLPFDTFLLFLFAGRSSFDSAILLFTFVLAKCGEDNSPGLRMKNSCGVAHRLSNMGHCQLCMHSPMGPTQSIFWCHHLFACISQICGQTLKMRRKREVSQRGVLIEAVLLCCIFLCFSSCRRSSILLGLYLASNFGFIHAATYGFLPS